MLTKVNRLHEMQLMLQRNFESPTPSVGLVRHRNRLVLQILEKEFFAYSARAEGALHAWSFWTIHAKQSLLDLGTTKTDSELMLHNTLAHIIHGYLQILHDVAIF